MKYFLAGIFILSASTLLAKAPNLSAEEILVPPPRIIRTCCSFGSELSVARIPFIKLSDITSIENIGMHQYLGDENEGNGNIYTKRGGFIDLGHLRDCADWTAYLYNLILLNKDKTDSIFIDLGNEGGSKSLYIKVPSDFNTESVSELAGKIAYDLSIWHEIATWFGASYVPLVPERYSSFSPEDLYSNLLGVNLSIMAIKSELDYNTAMTILISKTLDSLQAVTKVSETYAAMEEVEDLWWTREKTLPSKNVLLKRYFDSENQLVPWLIPNKGTNMTALKLNKPSAYLTNYYEIQIKLNFKFPVKSIYPSQDDRTITQKDFSTFIRYIEKDSELVGQRFADKGQRLKNRKTKKEKKLQPVGFIFPTQNFTIATI